MLKDYHVIHWRLSEGISILLGMHSNWHKTQGCLFFFAFFFFVKFHLVRVKLPNMHIYLQKFFSSVWKQYCAIDLLYAD